MTAAAFRASYSDFKLIKTRQSVQIVFEIPLHDVDAALDVLGGMPNPSQERWFGIAPLKPTAAQPQPQPDSQPRSAGAKRDWRTVPVPQQAGIRINEATFAAYLREEYPDDWHLTGDADACLKLICSVGSKRDLATNHKALTLWHQIDTHYQGWLAKERVGA